MFNRRRRVFVWHVDRRSCGYRRLNIVIPEGYQRFQWQFVCLTAVGAYSCGTSTADRAAIAG